MPRTAASLRTDPAARLAELERQRPEWQAWLHLLQEAEREAADPRWSAPVDQIEAALPPSSDAPLLHGRTLRLDANRAQQLMACLAAAASGMDEATSLREYQPPVHEAVKLIRASVRQDEDEIAIVATARGLTAGALASVSHLAALPILRSSGRALQDRIPQHWPHGYCPICAAWPIFAERRGLDRSRRLRCGRCAAAWEVEWLYCIYCGERNHERLASLEPDGRGEMLRVETCSTCKGYLKSISTLQGFPAFELLLQDLETVELDLVALDRGYQRPPVSGFALDTQVIDHASR
jgi:FdhE protein